jgi:hypothetical protein
VLVLIIIILTKIYCNTKKQKKLSKNKIEETAYKSNSNTLMNISEYKSYFNITPVWIRKYFTRIQIQNEYLIEKFNKMNQVFDNQHFLDEAN